MNKQRLAGSGLLLGAIAMALPFWVMVSLSLQPAADVLAGKAVWWWPLHPTLANYQAVFDLVPMARYAANSVLVAVVTTAGHVLLAAMAGFALARCHLPAKKLWYGLILLTLMIPPQVNVVPLFLLMSRLGLADSYAALIVPGLFGAFAVLLYRQWFAQLPHELEEAACLDGCSVWHYWWRIALPLAQPMTVTVALFVFIGSWNSFMWPLIITFSDEMQTLPLALAALKGSFRETTNWAVLMAGATLATLPVVLLCALGQRGLMQSLSAGIGKE
jgi:multiple sugar transport system permease protein